MFAIAEAALEAPDDPVRAVVFPAVTGGEQTLRELVAVTETQPANATFEDWMLSQLDTLDQALAGGKS